jgi:signal transduction histidine kinase
MINKEFKKLVVLAAMASFAFAGGAAWAGEPTPADAQAMVKKAMAFAKANGKDKVTSEINNTQGQFRAGSLYLVIQGADGTTVAHGSNEKLVGKMMINAKDVDGKEFVKEIIAAAKAKDGSWTEYKFTNPVSKKVELKAMYCERLDDTNFVCGGAFKG